MTPRVLVIAFLLLGCKSEPRAAPPPPDDAEVEDDADVLVGAFDTDDVELVLHPSQSFEQHHDVIFLDRPWTSYFVHVTNRASDPLRVQLPPYLVASSLGYTYPYDDGCLPPAQWLLRPPSAPVEVAPGETAQVLVEDLWYLGNARRPPPHAAGGKPTYHVRPIGDDDPLVRLAEALRDHPDDAGLAFLLAGGCTPGDAGRWTQLVRVEATLRAAGVDAGAPVFERTRARRADTIAKLTEQLATFTQTRSIQGLQILHDASDPSFRAFFAGDADVIALVERYAAADPSPLLTDLLAKLRAP